jgi:hypothetical protein
VTLPLSPEELKTRHGAYQKRDRAATLWGLAPLGGILLCSYFEKQLGLEIKPIFWIAAILLGTAWYVFWSQRSHKTLAREEGLLCHNCGHAFTGSSFEVTMASGRCGGCGSEVVGHPSRAA